MKNSRAWDYIISRFPDAVFDFEYSDGQILFYADRVAAENLNDKKLYSCIPSNTSSTGFRIATKF